jgi:hypothetical protein
MELDQRRSIRSENRPNSRVGCDLLRVFTVLKSQILAQNFKFCLKEFCVPIQKVGQVGGELKKKRNGQHGISELAMRGSHAVMSIH